MSSLFADALDALAQPEKAILDRLRATTRSTTVEDVLRLVEKRKLYCYNSHPRFQRANGEVIDLYDVFSKTVTWLHKFCDIDDGVVHHDSAHSVLLWTAFRLLLQTAIENTYSLAAVAESLELIAKNYSKCSLLEGSLLRNLPASSVLVRDLKVAITSFYNAILVYLARAVKLYSRTSLVRFWETPSSLTYALSSEIDVIRSTVNGVNHYAANVTTEAMKDNRELLSRIPDQLASFEGPMIRLRPFVEKVQSQMSDTEQAEIAQWLCHLEPKQQHNQHILELVPGTAQWLQKHPKFLDWHNSSASSVFWLKGNRGWGKTKLAAAYVQLVLLDGADATTRCPVAVFYCSMLKPCNFESKSTVVLRSIVKQLATSSSDGSLCSEMQALYRYKLETSREESVVLGALDERECIDFVTSISRRTPLTIIIDGMDEIGQEVHMLVRALNLIVNEAMGLVKIFITSRPSVIADLEFDRATSYNITEQDTKGDIKKFVRYKCDGAIGERRLLRGEISNDVQAEIVQSLSEGANGTFLWSSLELSRICNDDRFVLEEDITRSFSRLSSSWPDTLKDIVDHCLQREPTARRIFYNAVSWLLAAREPISEPELLAASLLDVNGHSWLAPMDATQLSVLCGNLVVLDEVTSNFRFLHPSVEEYLRSYPEFAPSGINLLVLSRCLLCYTANLSEADLYAESVSTLGLPALQAYASQHWMEHHHAVVDQELRPHADEMVVNFAFAAHGLHFNKWLDEVADCLEGSKTWTPVQLQLCAVLSDHHGVIYTAAAYNVECLLGRLLTVTPTDQVQSVVNRPNRRGLTPVYICACAGHSQMLSVLLTHGGSVDVTGGHIGNPLQAAVLWGHTECATLLLDHGASHLRQARFANTLDAALAGGHEQTILMLLERVSYSPEEKLRILDTASTGGLDEIIHKLSQKSSLASLDAKHERLQNALACGNYGGARLWVNNIDDIDFSCGHFGNALQAAAYGGNERCLSLLVDQGVALEATGLYGTALQAAALNGKRAAVEFLLDHGASDYNALASAASNGHVSIMHLLLDRLNPTLNQAQAYPRALDAASLGGQTSAVELLLVRCGPKSYGRIEQRALQQALYHGQTAVIDAFIHHYAKMSGISETGGISYGIVPRPPSLLGNVIPIRVTQDMTQYIDEAYATVFGCPQPGPGMRIDGGNSMRLAARLGDLSIIEKLLHSGHSATNSDDHDHNAKRSLPVEVAAAYGRVNAVDLFLNHGVPLGRSLLFAVRFKQTNVVEYLLGRFTDLDTDLPWEVFGSDRASDYVRLSWVEQSALALTIEFEYNDLFDLIWNHKLKSDKPLPTASFTHAAESRKYRYLDKMLDVGRLWNENSGLLQFQVADEGGNSTDRRKDYSKQIAIDLKKPLHALTQRSLEPLHFVLESQSSVLLRYIVWKDITGGSGEVCKRLFSIKLDWRHCNNVLVEIATASGHVDTFDLMGFLNTCCLAPKATAVLLEVAITSIYRNSKAAELFDNKEPFVRDAIVTIRDLYANDLDSLDEAVVRICCEAIRAQKLTLVTDFLNRQSCIQKLLDSMPDIISECIASVTYHSASHITGLLDLLLQHGAVADSNGSGNAIMRHICEKGHRDCFFLLVGQHIQIPSQSQRFHIPFTFPPDPLFGVASLGGPEKKHWGEGDLLEFTIHSFLYHCSRPYHWKAHLSQQYGGIVCFLLDNGYSCDHTSQAIAMFCRIVVYLGDRALLDKLVSAFAQPTEQSTGVLMNETGLLHAATLGGQHDLVRELCQLGADPKYRADWNFPYKWNRDARMTPIQAVIRNKAVDGVGVETPQVVETLMALVDIGVDASDERALFRYAMVTAARYQDFQTDGSAYGYQEMIVTLVHKGVDITAADCEHPYLRELVERGRVGWLHYVLQNGLDLRSAGTMPLELFEVAVSQYQTACADLIWPQCGGQPPDSNADSSPAESRAQTELHTTSSILQDRREGRGTQNVEFVTTHEPLSLIEALRAPPVEPATIDSLVKLGADVNLDTDGWTPLTILLDSYLMRIVFDQGYECLQRLLDYGADPVMPRRCEFEGAIVSVFPINLALRWPDPRRALEMLIKAGADASSCGEFGTPLFQARFDQTLWTPFGGGLDVEFPDLRTMILALAPDARDTEGKLSFDAKDGKGYIRFDPDHIKQLEEGDY